MSKKARIYMALSMAAVSSLLIANAPKISAAEKTKSAEEQVAIDEVTAVSNINKGSKDIANYKAIKSTKVNNDNIDIITLAILNSKESKGSDLTKNEILSEVLKTTRSIQAVLNKIRDSRATVEDYKFIQVNLVTDENVDDLNQYLKSYIKSLGLVREKAYKYIEAINEINAGTDELEYYNVVNALYNIDESNLSIMKAIVSEKKAEYNRNLNASEILACGDEAYDLVSLLEAINSEEAEVADYEYVNLEEVDKENVKDLNKVLKQKDLKTLKQVQGAINEFNAALKNINEGNETLKDYETLLIDGVEDSDILYIRALIEDARNEKGSDLTRTEIEKCIKDNKDILEALRKIDAGIAGIGDYETLGIKWVTNVNINVINAELKGKGFRRVTDIEIYISQKINIILQRINEGTATPEDFIYIGIHFEEEVDITVINAILKGKGITNIKDIEVYINQQINIILERIEAGTATVEDYTNIGITWVTDINIDYINKTLKGGKFTRITDVKVRIQEVINIILGKIQTGEAVEEDYTHIGIHYTGEIDIKIIGTYISEQISKTGSVTRGDIEAYIQKKIQIIIARIQDGTATVEDYEHVGIHFVSNVNITLINEILRGGSYSRVTDIKIHLENIINEVITRINAGKATVEDYTTIGIEGVTDVNITIINARTKDAGLDSIEKIKIFIKEDITIQIIERINEGTATVEDYIYIGITNVTKENILYVNLDLKGKNYTSITQIGERIDLNINIYALIVKINSNTVKIEDYTSIGITRITDVSITNINKYIKDQYEKKRILTVQDIQVYINQSINAVISKINEGTANKKDYLYLGVSGVTDEILIYVNADFKESNCDTVDKIQQRININIDKKIYISLIKILKGNGVLEDYTSIGISEVTKENISLINVLVKGKAKEILTVTQLREFIAINTGKELPSDTKFTASSSQGSAKNVIDGKPNTTWNSGNYGPAWIQMEFKEAINMDKLLLMSDVSPSCNQTYTIYSVDGDKLTEIASKSFTNIAGIFTFDCIDIPDAQYKAIRVQVSRSGSWISLREIRYL